MFSTRKCFKMLTFSEFCKNITVNSLFGRYKNTFSASGGEIFYIEGVGNKQSNVFCYKKRYMVDFSILFGRRGGKRQ